MRKSILALWMVAFSGVLAMAWAVQRAGAQVAPATAPTTATAPAPEGELPELWQKFLYYVRVARPDAAESHALAILSAKPDPRQLYALWVQSDRAGVTLARARGASKNLADLVDRLTAVIHEGGRAVRTDPAEIARWLDMLAGDPREFENGREQLIGAGEYAVSQLVNKLADDKTPRDLKARLVTVLPQLGKDAVRPLVECLNAPDAKVKVDVCRALGKIGYRHAAPYLKELAETKGIDPEVREAALGAVAATAGRDALPKPASELFYELALKYYERQDSVAPDQRYDTANVWTWKEGLGLAYQPVPRAIFNEVYAMRAAAKVLKLDPGFHPAVTLWLCAITRKEANLPAGAVDPTVPAGAPGAAFYLRASGAKYVQAVLTRALNDGDQAVARAAIVALEQTAGAENIVQPVAGGAPSLVQALGDPSREIRYLAAEALAKARPQRRFSGWDLVVPVLIEALRQTGTRSVVLADPDLQQRNKVKDLLRSAGLEVYDDAAFGKALQAARDAGGVDLVVLAGNVAKPDPAGVAQMLRSEAALRRVGIVVVVRPNEAAIANRLASSDALTVVLPVEKLTPEALAAALAELDDKLAGGGVLTPEQAGEWAVRAARCFHMLAETRNPVYDLTQAGPSLIAALKDKRKEVQIAAAEALGQFRGPAAQRALADLANDAKVAEEVRLAAYAATAESIGISGGDLTEKQANDLIGVVKAEGPLTIRQAAARVLGILNLESEKIKELILEAK